MSANVAVNWFFLSYARHDRETAPKGEDYIWTFYQDLDRDLRQRIPQQSATGFFDDKGITQGSIWKFALNQALATCRVFICMYSPSFFQIDSYCGIEWQVFSSRLADYLVNGKPVPAPPPLILPVLFNAPQELPPLPEVAQDIQWDDIDYPIDYRENGLRYLMRRKSKEEDYQDFRDTLIDKIIKAATDHPLSDLKQPPKLDEVKSAFSYKSDKAAGQAQKGPSSIPNAAGTRFADIVYVAASRSEMQKEQVKKTILDCYGDLAGWDWKPYLQEGCREVVFIAQHVADDEGFIHCPVTVETNQKLIELIDEAKRNNRVVVILVDTWTLYLEKYHDLMRHYDNTPLTRNCVVLVVWSTKDDDTEKNRTALEYRVRWALMAVSDIKDERYFANISGSLVDFTKALSITLCKKRQQLNEAAEFTKKIETDEMFTKPELPAPGGK
jgi:FxsC-like protein